MVDIRQLADLPHARGKLATEVSEHVRAADLAHDRGHGDVIGGACVGNADQLDGQPAPSLHLALVVFGFEPHLRCPRPPILTRLRRVARGKSHGLARHTEEDCRRGVTEQSTLAGFPVLCSAREFFVTSQAVQSFTRARQVSFALRLRSSSA